MVFNTNYKIHLLLFVIINFLSCELHGQEVSQRQSSIQISLGATHSRLIDEYFTLSRLKFSGTAFTSQLIYDRNSSNHNFSGFFHIGIGNAGNGNTDLSAKLYDLRMAVSYQKKIVDYSLFGQKSSVLIGPQLSISDYVLSNNKVLENTSVAFSNTLDILIGQRMLINKKNGLEISLAVPVAGFIKRDAYDGGVNTQLEDDYQNNFVRFLFGNTKAQFVNPIKLPRLRLAYTLKVHEKTDFVITYQFNFLSIKQEYSINLYGNGLLIGLRFRIWK